MVERIEVAVKAAIFKGDRVLVLTKRVAEEPGRFDDLPGGRLELGESLDACLRREVGEETGLDVAIGAPIAAWTWIQSDRQVVGITFHCLWRSGEVRLSPEHVAHDWLVEEEIRARGWHAGRDFEAVFRFHHGARSPSP